MPKTPVSEKKRVKIALNHNEERGNKTKLAAGLHIIV